MISFKDDLRAIRKNRGCTQRQTAAAIGITERNYQYYEPGEREPSMSVLISLAKYFDVTLDYLVGLSDDSDGVITVELNERLKQLRKTHSVTQVQVAAGCGMAERAYQRIEAGNKPSYDALISLAKYFDVSLDYLAGLSDDPTRK